MVVLFSSLDPFKVIVLTLTGLILGIWNIPRTRTPPVQIVLSSILLAL